MEAVMLNESFKALVREAFPERTQQVISVFDEVINHKASSDAISMRELKEQAIESLRADIATKDFVRAEIAELRTELRREIAELRTEIAEIRTELHTNIANVQHTMLRWVFGLQASTIIILIGAMKFLLMPN